MVERETLELLVEKQLADELKEKGLAEIATRQFNSKFRQFYKCTVLENPVLDNPVYEALAPMVQEYIEENVLTMDTVKNVLFSVKDKLNEATDAAKAISIQAESIYQMAESVMGISYLNTGLALTNMAVDMAGFVIVNEKLNALSLEIQQISTQLTQIANVQKNEKIAHCQMLIMRCNSISGKIKVGDAVDMDDLENLLIELRAFISELLYNLQDEALNVELVLKMVYTLLPVYTSLLSEFTRRHYFLKGSVPANHTVFMSLYDELRAGHFIQHMEDYYFLEQGMHSRDVIDALNAQLLIGINNRMQIEDQLELLIGLKSEENVLAFEEGVQKAVLQRMKTVLV